LVFTKTKETPNAETKQCQILTLASKTTESSLNFIITKEKVIFLKLANGNAIG
jgi:hypothetical protein